MEITSEYIAPWALANEQFPIHLIWKPEANFHRIEIDLPEELNLNEVLNVQNFSIENSKIIIKSTDLLSPDYFSLILESKEIFDELKKQLQINVRFLFNSDEQLHRTFYATIVRPKIEIMEHSTQLVIKDNTNLKNLLNFEVVHTGLGRIKVDFTASIKNKIISQSDSLYFDILEEIANEMDSGRLNEKENLKESDMSKLAISLDPIELQDTATKILDSIESGKFPNTVRKEVFKKLNEGLKDKDFRDDLIKVIYSKLQRMYISYVLYYFDRNPYENIDLPAGKIKLNLEMKLQKINFQIKYTDAYENCYDSLKTEINITDERKITKKTQIPVNIYWKGVPLVLTK